MSQIYSLGSGKGAFFRHRRSGRRTPLQILFFLLVVLLLCLLIFNFQLYPGISALARSMAENKAARVITSAFSESIASSHTQYEDMITVRYRTDGAIAGITCHTGQLNRTRNELFAAVLRSLDANAAVTVDLPLGNVLGGEAFSGRGPTFPVRVLLAEGAHSALKSEFRTAGINQTLHRILFSVTIKLIVMTPSHPVETSVTQEFCIAETVIVGEVPDAFTQINRLTDDIHESEIDDISDYGAELVP